MLFEDEKAVTSVLDEKSHSLKNKKIDPKRAEARGGKEPIRKVFVGGVAVDIPEEDIRKHFEKFGPVAEIEFPFNKLKNERKGELQPFVVGAVYYLAHKYGRIWDISFFQCCSKIVCDRI